MGLGTLAAHAGIASGIVVTVAIGIALRRNPDGMLKLIAGLVHIFARKEPKAQRALDVLMALCHGSRTRPDSRKPRPLRRRPGLGE